MRNTVATIQCLQRGHLWLWPSNWERYCWRCGVREPMPQGAVGVIHLNAGSAPMTIGHHGAPERAPIAPIAISLRSRE
jgi:hypothetical protein